MSWAFHHGWAFDRQFWAPLIAALGIAGATAERGYFGPAADTGPATILVGHSLGALLATEQAGSARALIAINGFDRFAAAPGFPGVPPRTLDRMIARAADAPDAVARDFRARCGSTTPLPAPPTGRLTDDLRLLRETHAPAVLDAPLLVLAGDADPILSAAHRAATFARMPHAVRETLPEGGHLLPLTHPAWCAERILRFVGALA